MGRRRHRRRGGRTVLVVLVLISVLVAMGFAVHQSMPAWYARAWYPLEFDALIQRHAERNALDPALLAAVIWRESGYDPAARSATGAVGLTQVLPSTARFIESQTDPPPGRAVDLGDPEVNIAFGAWYLHYLMDTQNGSVPEALAAYNGGPENLRRWKAAALAREEEFRIPEDIPFAETRAYVEDVTEARGIYRRAYGDRLTHTG